MQVDLQGGEHRAVRQRPGRGDLALVGGERDERRPLVDREVKRAASGVPARRTGLEDDSRGVRREGLHARDHAAEHRAAGGARHRAHPQTLTPNFVDAESWGAASRTPTIVLALVDRVRECDQP